MAIMLIALISATDGWQWCAIVFIGLIAAAALAHHFKDD